MGVNDQITVDLATALVDTVALLDAVAARPGGLVAIVDAGISHLGHVAMMRQAREALDRWREASGEVVC